MHAPRGHHQPPKPKLRRFALAGQAAAHPSTMRSLLLALALKAAHADRSKCRDYARDCCANADSEENAVCSDYYVPSTQPRSCAHHMEAVFCWSRLADAMDRLTSLQTTAAQITTASRRLPITTRPCAVTWETTAAPTGIRASGLNVRTAIIRRPNRMTTTRVPSEHDSKTTVSPCARPN